MSDDAHPVPKAPFVLLRGAMRDALNVVARGRTAPRAQERIWIDPSRMTRIYTRNPAYTPDFKRRHSGMVIGGDWDLNTEPLDRSWKVAACLAHFRAGVAWEDTGIYDRMALMIAERGTFDSCCSNTDIIARYQKIDVLYLDILENGYRDVSIRKLGVPRLPEGVFVHINRHGDPIFGGIGNHRMGIARALGLTRFPAQLGVVHPRAIARGALARYRDAPA